MLANFQDIKEGDVLEAYETRKVERELRPERRVSRDAGLGEELDG